VKEDKINKNKPKNNSLDKRIKRIPKKFFDQKEDNENVK